MNIINKLLKINLFHKVIKQEKLSIKELASLILILYEKDIAFELSFTPKTSTNFPQFKLELKFAPEFKLSFTITICE